MGAYFLQNFGCRANQAEGAALARALEARGLTGVAPAAAASADWIVLNTCTVTAEADREARRALRRWRRQAPAARIAVTGCYAQRAPQEVAALDGVSLVCGNAAKFELPARLLPLAALAPPPKLVTQTALERTRPIIKVQDGCSRRCTYCVVPFVRGRARSLPLGEVLEQANACAAAGHSEAVLSGINLGEWGRDLGPGLTLTHLVAAVLERTALPRIRLSSIEPADWPAGLTQLLTRERRLCRHLHLPLQSGSDTVLRRMRRRYRASTYAALVERLAAAVPGIAIGADVMAGFPGETEDEFTATVALIERLPLAYLHVFGFSERQPTEAAARLAAGAWRAVPEATIAARVAVLRALGERKQAAFAASQAGQQLEVVALAEGTHGLSDNYLRLRLPSPQLPGSLLTMAAA